MKMEIFERTMKKSLFLSLQIFQCYKGLVTNNFGGKNFGTLSSPKLNPTKFFARNVGADPSSYKKKHVF